MPRYLIERTILVEKGLDLPGPDYPARARQEFIDNNREYGVTWLHSYVTPDDRRCFCLYEAPSPEAVRRAAMSNGLAIDRINEVRLLDPYSYPHQPDRTADRPA